MELEWWGQIDSLVFIAPYFWFSLNWCCRPICPDIPRAFTPVSRRRTPAKQWLPYNCFYSSLNAKYSILFFLLHGPSSFVPDHQRTDWVNRVAKSPLGGDLFQDRSKAYSRILDGRKLERFELRRAIFCWFFLYASEKIWYYRISTNFKDDANSSM